MMRSTEPANHPEHLPMSQLKLANIDLRGIKENSLEYVTFNALNMIP